MRVFLAVVVVLMSACASEPAEPLDVEPKGPPDIESGLLDEHAKQFNEDLPVRRPGSQQEFAAATYLLAHLQDSGYVVELDYVPVEDLVRSTNVVAAAPGGEPRVVLVVPYDDRMNGWSIATFLEIARALRVRDQDHRVQFVALGAQSAAIGDGLLGARRLAQRLIDDDLEPIVVDLRALAEPGDDVAGTPRFYGDEATEFVDATGFAGARLCSGCHDIVWDRAGFDYVVLEGDALEVGRSVLEYLEETGG